MLFSDSVSDTAATQKHNIVDWESEFTNWINVRLLCVLTLPLLWSSG